MKPLFALLRRPLLSVAGFSFFVNLLLLAPALFILQLFDRVLTSYSSETLLVLLLGMAVALALMLVFDYLRGRLQGVAGNIIADSLSPTVVKLLLDKLARRGDRVFTEGPRDVWTLRNLFAAQGLLALFDAPWALVYVGIIWLAHPVLGMAAAGASILMLALAVINDRITRRDIEVLQREATRATRYLEASMQNAEVAQSLGMADALIARWRQLSANVATLQRPTARKSVAMAALTRTTRQSVQVVIQALGAYLVISGESTAGVLVASTILLGRALAPVEQIVGSWRVLAEGRLAYQRLRDLLGAGEAQPERMPLPAPDGRLDVHGLAYCPPKSERLIVGGVSFSLEPGESLVVTGPSGAGKSTLLRLLTGVWQPTAGVVRLDQVNLAHWPRDDLGPWIGYVPQDVQLFGGTVAENIARLGQVESPAVIRAAQRAGVHELILSLPEGYDTVIDHMEVMLSPGQRQRIALARALYGEPKLLVLDEPNSNLDGAGELALGEALKALRGVVTTITVTHRTTLVQHADKMLVLDAGRVLHYGSVHDVLQAMQQPSAKPGGAQVVALARPVGVPAHATTAGAAGA